MTCGAQPYPASQSVSNLAGPMQAPAAIVVVEDLLDSDRRPRTDRVAPVALAFRAAASAPRRRLCGCACGQRPR